MTGDHRMPQVRGESELPMPRALGAALVEEDATLERFSRLSEKEKREFIGGAQSLTTGYEMRQYVRAFIRGEEAR
jgi:uncharacterized protein (DUF58 family)